MQIKKIIFLLFLTLGLNAQTNTVQIVYGVAIVDDNAFKVQTEQVKKSINLLKFELVMNEKEYSFSAIDMMDNANQELKMAQILSGYTSAIYFEKNSEYMYQNHNDVLGSYILKKPKQLFDWAITSETKMIDGFLCYKATTSETIVNPAGTFVNPIIAWFAPSMPISQGPLGIGGLPGLILELQRKNVTFGAKEITRDSNKTIKAPDLKKAITLVELQKMKETFLNSKD